MNMKTKIILFLIIFISLAVYFVADLINELEMSEVRWMWVVIYAVILGICVARSVQLARELLKMIKETQGE
ncbi:MAG: hypothetical protein II315_00475 [Rikenellaceae bacterium]|jgi:ABC-type proline/glycine betaine transport system permease subunit|nr:hypothetical protein [Rikenellaceae bacterium]